MLRRVAGDRKRPHRLGPDHAARRLAADGPGVGALQHRELLALEGFRDRVAEQQDLRARAAGAGGGRRRLEALAVVPLHPAALRGALLVLLQLGDGL